MPEQPRTPYRDAPQLPLDPASPVARNSPWRAILWLVGWAVSMALYFVVWAFWKYRGYAWHHTVCLAYGTVPLTAIACALRRCTGKYKGETPDLRALATVFVFGCGLAVVCTGLGVWVTFWLDSLDLDVSGVR